MPDAVRALADAGHGDRLLLGGEHHDRAAGAASGVPGHAGPAASGYAPRPRPSRVLGEELVRPVPTSDPGRASAVARR
ncbi:Phosphotriesterase OS=Streptomyces alboniger OX=132473 GN=CP975_04035 PE=3 SV=1 [Streptomyces alboniger]